MNISKQAVHQRLNLHLKRQEEKLQLLPLIRQIREDHPKMSAKKMYLLLKPESIGRDRFEVLCFENGFKVSIGRNPYRTTNSLGVTRFENHLAGVELTGINQAWSSDITYYRIGENVYFLTFIMDLYSRRIVGHKASKRLLCCETTMPALQMAIRLRKTGLEGLIFHSDGGGQYFAKIFLQLTRKEKLINSMAETVYENAHAERINGIIKNEYLVEYNPTTFEELEKMSAKAVLMYNGHRPHKSLNNMIPNLFELIMAA
jgi:putative transposase